MYSLVKSDVGVDACGWIWAESQVEQAYVVQPYSPPLSLVSDVPLVLCVYISIVFSILASEL